MLCAGQSWSREPSFLLPWRDFRSTGFQYTAGAHNPPPSPLWVLEQVESSQVKNYSPGYMEQAPSSGHQASPQSGLDVGCRLCSSSKKLRGLDLRAQARRICILSHSMCHVQKGVRVHLIAPKGPLIVCYFIPETPNPDWYVTWSPLFPFASGHFPPLLW